MILPAFLLKIGGCGVSFGAMNEEIRNYRRAKNLTQEEFSRLLGIGQSQLSQVECGRRAISKKVARNLHSIDPETFTAERLLSG